MRKMRVLVTGSNGFIGSHLTAALVDKGYRVKCLVRNTSNLDLLKKYTDLSSLELCYGDINDPISLSGYFTDVDYIYHLAATVKALSQDAYDKVNFIGVKNVLDVILRENPEIKKFVFISSIAANGPSTVEKTALEDDEPHPIDAYGRSKLKAEKMIREKYMDKLPITILRPASVVGPGDVLSFDVIFRPVSNGIKIYMRGPARYYSIVYVSDLIDGMILAGETKDATGELFYISGDGVETWQGLQDITAEALGTKFILTLKLPKFVLFMYASLSELVGKIFGYVPFVNSEKAKEMIAPAWTCSNEKAKKILGFSPKVSLVESMCGSALWFKENGWLN
jgi:nucleoside-diphosphate-sugar epimerase